MWKLLENIGLGLFVNALYSVFTSNINGAVIATMSASVVIMAVSTQKGECKA